jgi:hypothetical protein
VREIQMKAVHVTHGMNRNQNLLFGKAGCRVGFRLFDKDGSRVGFMVQGLGCRLFGKARCRVGFRA